MADKICPPVRSSGKSDGLKDNGGMSTIKSGSFSVPNKTGQADPKGKQPIMGK